MGLWDWALAVGGAGLLGLALWLLYAGREPRARRVVSQPTRMSLGIAAGFLGYHLAAWGLPVGWVTMRVDPGAWPWVVAGSGAWCVLALLMDVSDASRAARERDAGTGPDEGPRWGSRRGL